MESKTLRISISEYKVGTVLAKVNRLKGKVLDIHYPGKDYVEIEFELPASFEDDLNEFLGSVQNTPVDKPYCSFCGKGNSEVRRMFHAPAGDIHICDECVQTCTKMISDGHSEA